LQNRGSLTLLQFGLSFPRIGFEALPATRTNVEMQYSSNVGFDRQECVIRYTQHYTQELMMCMILRGLLTFSKLVYH